VGPQTCRKRCAFICVSRFASRKCLHTPSCPNPGAATHTVLQEVCCPLCITDLDETERSWVPCPCGYQMCLFCYKRLKTEFDNHCACPNPQPKLDTRCMAWFSSDQQLI
jgi:hypothetical protein